MSDEPPMDDDRLLHEMVWAAENFLCAMKGAVIPVSAAPFFVNLEGWCKGVREVWRKRDTRSPYDPLPRINDRPGGINWVDVP